ncbi:MAG: hypothetical protein OXM61_09660 [Candidatus Poribacteria bacterium]|nr:hypothetical protein [Candidatus Poribacteria bacterium]
MFYIQQQIEKRNIFVPIFIVFLCIATFVHALTWKELYEALDLFLNARELASTVAGQIKTLEDRTAELEIEIPQKKSIHARKSSLILSYHLSLSRMKQEVKDAEKALSAAEAATSTAEANKTFAEDAVKTSARNENSAYLAWFTHKYRSGCYNCPDSACATEAQLNADWQEAKAELAQDRKDLEAAKAEVKACKKAEKEARTEHHNKRYSLALAGPYIGHEISTLSRDVLSLHTEIENLEKELKAKNKELVAKRARQKEIDAQYPTVRAYMTAFLAATKTEGFDFDAYIEANPPPSIIFDSE